MKFHSSFSMMQPRPPKNGKTQGYSGRVERIDVVGDKEILHDAVFLLRKRDHSVCKLLKYPNLAYLIGLAKVAATDTFPEPQVVECILKRCKRHYQIPKPLAIR